MMVRAVSLLALPLVAGCMAAPSAPDQAAPSATPVVGNDVSIPPAQHPLIGKWIVETVGTTRYPGDEAFVHFMADDFLDHSGGCAGSQPAFYALDGERITLTRKEGPVVGKCPTAAYAARERTLNAFLDRLTRWRKPSANRLELVSSDGIVAVLSAPVHPVPALAGKWDVVSIGGRPFVPASVTFDVKGVSASAQCNTLYTEYSVGPAGVRIAPGGAATEMGCTPEFQEQDGQLFGALGAVTGHRLQANGILALTGGPGIVLRRAIAPVPIPGPR